jgi:hypothetical protein
MKKETAIKVFVSIALAVPILLPNPAIAEPVDSRPASTNGFGAQTGSPPPLFEASLNSSYSLPGGAKVGGVKLGDSDAFELGLNMHGGTPIDENWMWSWGGRLENLFLGSIAGAPIPEHINALHLDTGVGYKFNERWMISGFVGPTLYRFEDVGGGTLGFSGGGLAMYRPSAALTWNFGVMIAPDSDVKALPVLGVKWLINDQFTLELGIPKTRLSYRIDTKWKLYTGLDMVGTTFRTGKNFGATIGTPQYGNALATYRDIRLGAGVGYEVTRGLRAEIEAGESVYRRIDYTRIDQKVEFDPAPYICARLIITF